MNQPWKVEYSAEFERWWLNLVEKEQDAVDRAVLLLWYKVCVPKADRIYDRHLASLK